MARRPRTPAPPQASRASQGYTPIPSWEFGEGAVFEPWNSRLIGVSGKVYEGLVISQADFDKWLENQKKW